ncbi:MAG: TetR/AcrR family transcriptional regulator [Ilumatobacter sp.]|jgi:AcrR family transcriptional regulator|uniref:TetR/AcrR family transcriptional regulator n=1 Tax=Ilumatobacter sp. TaxID=1967498 RepID=UPI003919F462
MVTTRVRNRHDTEQELVDAVGRLLARDGVAAFGVNAVAREAGVDKVLIYRYFDGLDGLLRAFAQSASFWPSIEEVLGQGDSDLRSMPLADRWATGLVRYARALRRRPITREVLAWEQIEKNGLTEILRVRREEWFAELLGLLPDDNVATDIDPIATALVIATSIHYLVARSRLHGDFSGLDIDTDAGWAVVEDIVHALAHRTLNGAAERSRPTDIISKEHHA